MIMASFAINRYSIVNQQEQQLIEELKQQQLLNSRDHQILKQYQSNNGRILSPYESWTASQLLHEHERRQSPHQPQDCHTTNLPPYELTNSTDVNNIMFDHHLMPNIPPLPENTFYVYGSPTHVQSQHNSSNIYGLTPTQQPPQPQPQPLQHHQYTDNMHCSGSSSVTSSTTSGSSHDVIQRKSNTTIV